jgi:preprotein translocase subunit SecG
MLQKLSLVTAVAACLLVPTSVFAKGGSSGGSGGSKGGSSSMGSSSMGSSGKGSSSPQTMRSSGMNTMHNGGERRFWHGHWYGYGVGACWRLTPTGYVWICG